VVIETTIEVDAPPATVFGVLAEPRTYPRWLRGARKIRSVEPSFPAEGSAFHHQVGVAPLVINDETKVREVEPDRVLDLDAKARPGGVAHVRFELEELAGGRTHVRLKEEPDRGPGRVVWSFGGRLWMAPLLRMRNEDSLRKLKELVEQP
jgi:uncharacterized protein YndB with AHSA1/START domain